MAKHDVMLSLNDEAYNLITRAANTYKMPASEIVSRWLVEIGEVLYTFLSIKQTNHSRGWVRLEYRLADGGGVPTYEELGTVEIPPEYAHYLDEEGMQ